MDINEIKEKVLNIVKMVAVNDVERITYDTVLKGGNFGIDSIKFVDLIVTIEEEFDVQVEFNPLDIDKFSTVEKIACYLQTKIAEGNA